MSILACCSPAKAAPCKVSIYRASKNQQKIWIVCRENYQEKMIMIDVKLYKNLGMNKVEILSH